MFVERLLVKKRSSRIKNLSCGRVKKPVVLPILIMVSKKEARNVVRKNGLLEALLHRDMRLKHWDPKVQSVVRSTEVPNHLSEGGTPSRERRD